MKKVVPLEGFGGGGTPLNFKIVAYATEEEMAAAQPKENTIGVITNVPITGYKFSATEPEDMNQGEVWICVGSNSDVAFDIVDGAKMYPLSVKQYIDGVLVNKTAKTYQNDTWINWIKTILPNSDYTWVKASTDNIASITHNSDGTVKISAAKTNNVHASARTDTMIDLTPYKTLTVVYNASNNSNAYSCIGVTTQTSVGTAGNEAIFTIASYAANAKVTATLSIENVNTPCYIFATLYNQNVTFYSITLT